MGNLFDVEPLTGGRMLPVGRHTVKIASAESTLTSRGNPQVELQYENDNGSIRDWLVYAEEYGQQKLVTLFLSALGVPPSTDDAENGKLTDQAVARLKGRTVVIDVGEEQDNRDPSKMRRRVYYRLTDPVQAQSDIPADTTGLPVNPASRDDEDIPF